MARLADQYEARIAEQRALAEQELVENFIHRLREQIEDARQQLGYLNATLSALRFGGERFEFITRPEPSLRQVYNLIMDSQAVLGSSLFDSDFRKRYQQGWDLLFERLTWGRFYGYPVHLSQGGQILADGHELAYHTHPPMAIVGGKTVYYARPNSTCDGGRSKFETICVTKTCFPSGEKAGRYPPRVPGISSALAALVSAERIRASRVTSAASRGSPSTVSVS